MAHVAQESGAFRIMIYKKHCLNLGCIAGGGGCLDV